MREVQAAGGCAGGELYTSPLFRGRRAWVERTCDRWLVLSAERGLVEPGRVLAPYDLALTDLPRAARRTWSDGVVQALEQALGGLSGVVFELHAGSAYLDNGLVAGLREQGCRVEASGQGSVPWPAAGVLQAGAALSCPWSCRGEVVIRPGQTRIDPGVACQTPLLT